jgi:hypothetical protein
VPSSEDKADLVMTESPERQLWCAIITRAVDDALDRVSGVGGQAERARIREDARRWFVQNGGDFRQACEAAGYDADFLRQRILKQQDHPGLADNPEPSGPAPVKMPERGGQAFAAADLTARFAARAGERR